MKLTRAKISNYEIKKIIKHFCLYINAPKTVLLPEDMNRNKINHFVNLYFNLKKRLIF